MFYCFHKRELSTVLDQSGSGVDGDGSGGMQCYTETASEIVRVDYCECTRKITKRLLSPPSVSFTLSVTTHWVVEPDSWLRH